MEARKPLLSKSLDQLKRETILLKVRDIETDLRFPRYQTVGEAMGTMWRKLKLETKEKDCDVCIVRSGVWLCRSRQIGSYGMKDRVRLPPRIAGYPKHDRGVNAFYFSLFYFASGVNGNGEATSSALDSTCVVCRWLNASLFAGNIGSSRRIG